MTEKPSPEVITFILRSRTEPFKDDPPFADDFYNAIGRVVLMWGRLEQSLDNLVVSALTIASRTAPARPFMVSLNRKLTLLRELFSQCPDLQPLQSRADALADRIEAHGNDRHLVVHTNWLHFDEGPPPRIIGRHLKHKSGKIIVKRVFPGIAQLAQIAGARRGARVEALAMLVAMTELIDPEVLQKAPEQAQSGDGRFPPIEL
jgi:hypothetical protein